MLKVAHKESGKIFLYKEKTNVFPYYILKMILLYNTNDFILWCKKNNTYNILNFDKTPKTFNSLFLFPKK